jgi:hypothetical protein
VTGIRLAGLLINVLQALRVKHPIACRTGRQN